MRGWQEERMGRCVHGGPRQMRTCVHEEAREWMRAFERCLHVWRNAWVNECLEESMGGSVGGRAYWVDVFMEE